MGEFLSEKFEGKLKDSKENVKVKMYWHIQYADGILFNELKNWSSEQWKNIIYLGEYTTREWEDFIKNAPRDNYGEPIVFGSHIDSMGNPIE